MSGSSAVYSFSSSPAVPASVACCTEQHHHARVTGCIIKWKPNRRAVTTFCTSLLSFLIMFPPLSIPSSYSPCSLTGDTSNPCSYRLKVQGSDQWHFISANSRNRVGALVGTRVKVVMELCLKLVVQSLCTCDVLYADMPLILCVCVVWLQIVTVCDFYSFIGYIQKGIIKKDGKSNSTCRTISSITIFAFRNGVILASFST